MTRADYAYRRLPQDSWTATARRRLSETLVFADKKTTTQLPQGCLRPWTLRAQFVFPRWFLKTKQQWTRTFTSKHYCKSTAVRKRQRSFSKPWRRPVFETSFCGATGDCLGTKALRSDRSPCCNTNPHVSVALAPRVSFCRNSCWQPQLSAPITEAHANATPRTKISLDDLACQLCSVDLHSSRDRVLNVPVQHAVLEAQWLLAGVTATADQRPDFCYVDANPASTQPALSHRKLELALA